MAPKPPRSIHGLLQEAACRKLDLAAGVQELLDVIGDLRQAVVGSGRGDDLELVLAASRELLCPLGCASAKGCLLVMAAKGHLCAVAPLDSPRLRPVNGCSLRVRLLQERHGNGGHLQVKQGCPHLELLERLLLQPLLLLGNRRQLRDLVLEALLLELLLVERYARTVLLQALLRELDGTSELGDALFLGTPSSNSILHCGNALAPLDALQAVLDGTAAAEASGIFHGQKAAQVAEGVLLGSQGFKHKRAKHCIGTNSHPMTP